MTRSIRYDGSNESLKIERIIDVNLQDKTHRGFNRPATPDGGQ